jgi:NAD-dependent dihydropyrimidine dehydrogenase PreA subunit
MATCIKKENGDDCDRNYHNRRIVEECPENQADIEKNKPVYDTKETKSRCLSALGD